MPAFVGENLFLLGVNLVFAGAHRTWFLLRSGRRRFAFCIGISCEINTRYPCTSGGCIKGYPGRIFYCAGAHLDAIKKPVNTDFFHHGISNLLEGFEHLDRELFEMAKIFRMKFWNKMYYLYFGGLFAYFRSACAIAIGMCFKAGIAAEIIGIPKGSIGEKLYNAKIYLETPDLFAWTFVIIAVSVLFEKIFQWLLSLLAHRLSVK